MIGIGFQAFERKFFGEQFKGEKGDAVVDGENFGARAGRLPTNDFYYGGGSPHLRIFR